MDSTLHGKENVFALVTEARKVYEFQDFTYHGPYEGGFIEEYTTRIQGRPTRVVVTIAFNEEGKTQHVVVNHRPRSSVELFARVMNERFAGTPVAEPFKGAS